jgi:hypothetical protein
VNVHHIFANFRRSPRNSEVKARLALHIKARQPSLMANLAPTHPCSHFLMPKWAAFFLGPLGFSLLSIVLIILYNMLLLNDEMAMA